MISTPFGTIALGNAISAIAAALEPQKVQLNMLLSLADQRYSSTINLISENNFGIYVPHIK